MKILKPIFLFVVLITALACNKDDDNNPEPPYELTRTNFVGSYSMNFLEFKSVETITFTNGSTSTSTTTLKGTLFQNVNAVFNADGTFSVSGYYTTVQTTINPDGSTQTDDPVIHDAAAEMGSGTYTLNPSSKKLTITPSEGEPTVFDITVYTPTEMQIFSETTYTEGNSTVVITQDLRFSR